ncbi:PQQ-dependent sugar dehydrogenase [Rubripirellula reticaptiva]|uniref:Soluble aldose sugar dehydrogenase YliI n=1 Tax=Rubripirellula reticaptiva TaxID=2528013 RepID=A0A5C6F720_9BACT|nr:PQQ-dependent sugar dehydrogenase [Rubripirellula reticaptiva]TWU55629.1 Soluble aldose sugar dehydrogenase YliI precursor [Rubripirellula reticaptiva]
MQRLLFLWAWGLAAIAINANADRANADEPLRWQSSRIKGTPDPPLPYRLERIFADADLKGPTEMVRLPETNRWVVVQQNGTVVTFDKSDPSNLHTAMEGKTFGKPLSRSYGITFDPDFPRTPECYLAYTSLLKTADGTRVSRFRVTDTNLMTIDPASETVLATWNSEGHSGGSLHFGADGYLYVSVGDGQDPNPPDRLDTGQDLSDFEASILRIDVRGHSPEQPYRIPKDNPFVGVPGVRGEIWAFGLRNPWKMSFNPKDNSLWTGDVGWEMREMVYKIERGANYGWSQTEGSQVVKSDGYRSDIPITPPTVEHDHTEARSITGGYFWQSDRISALKDAYIYGDWMTGKIWALKYADGKVTWQAEIADSTLQIICFASDDDGEILTIGYDGTIHRLIPNLDESAAAAFPRRLSDTGLFTKTEDQTPAVGVIPYSINAHHWSDHTDSQQWIGIVSNEKISTFDKSDWQTGQVAGFFSFPHNTVLAKTVTYLADTSDPASQRRLETQVLHRNHDDWNAYNYIWNDDQTDAILQDNVAVTRELTIADPSQPSGHRTQTWLHASRDQCSLCHIWSASTVHGFKLDQLNRTYADESENQLDKLKRIGLLDEISADVGVCANPYDHLASIEDRARTYLDLNCAHCHRRGGGGTAPFELVRNVDLDQLNLVNAMPTQGTFNIPDARVVASGDPSRSVLLYRMAKAGRGHMPQFGPTLVDDAGIQIVHDWIASLDADVPAQPYDDTISQLIHSPVDDDTTDRINSLLQSVPSALALSVACADRDMPASLREQIAAKASKDTLPEVRDLFERFLPAHLRIVRLGDHVIENELLSIPGDIARGRDLYFNQSGITCKQCHRISDPGPAVGPDLNNIGGTRTPLEVLQSILDPSAKIEEKYRGYIALTTDGQVISGLKQSETKDAVYLIDAQGKSHELLQDEIEDLKPLEKSLMPDRLLADLTAQQAADLLAFLTSQKSPN